MLIAENLVRDPEESSQERGKKEARVARLSGFMLKVLIWSVLSMPVCAELAGLKVGEIKQLAQQGETTAQVEMGLIFQYGQAGVAKDHEKALTWFCRAAYQGSAFGQKNLGWMFLIGQGVERDEAIAAYWFEQAAALGDDYSQRLLQQLDKGAEEPENVCAHVASPEWLGKRCRRSHCRRIVETVERLAPQFGLDSNLVLSVIAAESAFKPRVCSQKNACGLMQLMPLTAKRFGVRDLKDLEQNIRGGMAYLQWLLAYFQGDLRFALAGYNAGEGSVVKYRGIPPYPETEKYVKRIIEDYGKTRHAYRKNWIKPSRIMTASAAGVTGSQVAAAVLDIGLNLKEVGNTQGIADRL